MEKPKYQEEVFNLFQRGTLFSGNMCHTTAVDYIQYSNGWPA